MFIPACQSPSLVAPSPKVQTVISSTPRYFCAMAFPAAGGTCDAMEELMDTKFWRCAAKWCGIWRPRQESLFVPRHWLISSAMGTPIARPRVWSR